jgi:ABC-type multidrug transport system permease subunit
VRHPLLKLIAIRYKEFIREPGIVFWTIIFPILMAWGLGMAFTGNGDLPTSIALIESQHTTNNTFQEFLESASTQTNEEGNTFFAKKLDNEELGTSTFHFYPTDSAGAVQMLKQGKSQLTLKEKPDSLIYIFDPHNSEAKLAYLVLNAAIENKQTRHTMAEIRPLTTVGTRYIDFLVPGLLALGVMNSFLWGISYALIDMRVKKLMRRLVATPMKKSHFLISHFFARISLAFVEAFILIGFSKYFFDIKLEGSWVAFFLIFLAGNLAFTGIGVLISSRTSNSRVGTGLINVISLPMTILSGIFFSYHNFPDSIVKIIELLPLTILADNIRSVFIEGAGVVQVLPGTIILTSLGLVLFTIGLRIFKWY